MSADPRSGGSASQPPPPPDEASSHARDAADVLTALGTTSAGLSDAEARARLTRDGPNALAPPRRASVLAILVAQLKSVIVALLAAAVAISLALGDRAEAIAIGAVLVLNAAIGFVTELRARRAMEALLEFDIVRATVVRDGRLQVIDAREIVRGDVIEIEAERQVPADARLFAANDLRIDEAILTGESLPVSKTVDPLPADTLLADRHNMIFKGTLAVSGLGRAVVVMTGPNTEVGRIGAMVDEAQPRETPLEARLDTLGRRLVWLTLGVAALVAGLGAAQGVEPLLLLQTAIALAVAAVPEALPVVATIALAVGMSRMARRQALVRRLASVETLGSTTVICTDKTRTLTSGRMAVVRVKAAATDARLSRESAPPEPIRRVLESAALASRPGGDGADQRRTADPEDIAAIEAAAAAGLDRDRLVRERPEVAVLPFTSARRFMAAIHRLDGATIAYVKGAPRAVVERSSRMLAAGGVEPLDDERRGQWLAGNDELAGAGLRVLAVASGEVSGTSEDSVRDLVLLGLIGLEDPPADGVKATIARLKGAGLRTVMLTGDQRRTAEAIGRQLDLFGEGERVVDGRDIERMADAQRAEAAAAINAFSRITPEHKLVVVRALQARGEVVAMIGDGVNDAPALAQADIGVAMGRRGTDAAKQAASIVLLDDRFETVAAAVEEGRVIFANIRKFVFYLFSCNVAEVLVLLVAGVAGLPLPLAPLQLLWLNIVTDTFPALSLALEPADPDVMNRPPRRPDDEILSGAFIRSVGVYGALITTVTLAAFVWALEHGGPQHASTVAFMTLAFAQTAHLGNARSAAAVLKPSSMFANPFAIAGVLLAVTVQLAGYYVPALAAVLDLSPLTGGDWLVIAGAAAIPAVGGQLVRAFRARSG